jgi:[protein-PII] uridylyltransferase
VDVFYVKDLFGHKVLHERKLKDIRERLTKVLADPAADSTSLPPARRRNRPVAAAE